MVAFDTITRTKGQAFIQQLEAYLGEAAFRDGIRRYIAAHAYGNATTADLWQALEAASGQPVAAIAAGYTEQSGVPLIRAETRRRHRANRPSAEQLDGRVHRFSQLAIGAEVIRDPEIGVTDLRLSDADLVLGVDFLQSRRVWMSYGSQQIFLSRRS